MKNVLILSVNFPPKGGAGVMRTVKFTKYLPEFGWRPVVVTPPVDTKRIKDDSLVREVKREPVIHRPEFFDYREHFPKIFVKLFRPIEKRMFFPDKYVQWNRIAFKYISRHILAKEKVDLVYTSLGPHSTMILAYMLKLEHRIPFFLDFRDPFSFYQYAILDNKKTYQKKAIKIEEKVFKAADQINNVSQTIKRRYEELYPYICPKSSLIHNGYDEDDFADFGKKAKNSIFTIGYNGSFSRIVPIRPLMEAIIEIHQRYDIRMRLSIATPINKRKLTSRYAYLFQNDLVDYKGFLPHKESLKHIYQADISALILNDVEATRGILPAKTFEYMRVANPILLLHRKDSPLAKIIEKTKTGIAANISDPDEIVKSLLMLHEQWLKKNQSHQPNWDEIEKYESRTLTRQLADFFDKIVLKK